MGGGGVACNRQAFVEVAIFLKVHATNNRVKLWVASSLMSICLPWCDNMTVIFSAM